MNEPHQIPEATKDPVMGSWQKIADFQQVWGEWFVWIMRTWEATRQSLYFWSDTMFIPLYIIDNVVVGGEHLATMRLYMLCRIWNIRNGRGSLLSWHHDHPHILWDLLFPAIISWICCSNSPPLDQNLNLQVDSVSNIDMILVDNLLSNLLHNWLAWP